MHRCQSIARDRLKGNVDSAKDAIGINVASWRSCLKNSKLCTVAASAGRLFQLVVVRGRKLKRVNCIVTRRVEKLRNACVERVSQGI